MSKLITKARAGVTLVELLVVILIVTILSVSMLPLLQPFVVEAQYAAEAIPVIGNIRTKVGIYQYDKGKLPCIAVNSVENGKDTGKISGTPQVETWIATESQTATTPADDPSTVDYFCAAQADFPDSEPPLANVSGLAADSDEIKKHIQTLCDIDYQDLKGKRSKPNHYQYLVMRNGTDYAYFVGCFGDGNGLKMGTGYAVCEIVSASTGHKYVGTWKRYKPVSAEDGNDVPVCFTSKIDTNLQGTKQLGCFVPDKNSIETAEDQDGKLNIIGTMETYGWEF